MNSISDVHHSLNSASEQREALDDSITVSGPRAKPRHHVEHTKSERYEVTDASGKRDE
jgi:hypothetical protein